MKIKVRVHEANFTNDMMKKPFHFINIRNNYKRRHITVTNVFLLREVFDIDSKSHHLTSSVNVTNPGRPLPIVIAPQTEWETWISSHEVTPSGLNSFLVRLANGKYIASRKRKDVSPSGIVPGNK
jgi:hypothetical protein